MSCKLINSYIKISSLGLMIKHEQFYLNYSTKHINSQKLFLRTLFPRIVKPSVTILEKSPIVGSLCEPEFHGHFRPHFNQYMIYTIIYAIFTQTAPSRSLDAPFLFQKLYQFGPKFWDRSNRRSRHLANRNIEKHLNKV